MTNNVGSTAVKNFTAEMEAQIIAASPLNLASAKALGLTMGKGYRSIISKALSLKALGFDCEYVSKIPEPKREAVETKAQIVADVAEYLGVALSGLDKATVKALCTLRSALVPAFMLTKAEQDEIDVANS